MQINQDFIASKLIFLPAHSCFFRFLLFLCMSNDTPSPQRTRTMNRVSNSCFPPTRMPTTAIMFRLRIIPTGKSLFLRTQAMRLYR